MKITRVLYGLIETILFAGASIYVTDTYISNGSNLEITFGLFLLLIFINQIIKSAKQDANQKDSEEKND